MECKDSLYYFGLLRVIILSIFPWLGVVNNTFMLYLVPSTLNLNCFLVSLIFKSNSSNHSYLQLFSSDKNGLLVFILSLDIRYVGSDNLLFVKVVVTGALLTCVYVCMCS